MTREECIALLDRYSNYNGMGIPNLAGCKEAMKKAVELLSAKPSEDLEEAARLKYPQVIGKRVQAGDLNETPRQAFIAGAEWQKEQMLQLAKNRYEVVMAFGTGNPDVDHALQMDRLALVKIIEEGSK